MKKFFKILGVLVIILLLVAFYFYKQYKPASEITFGITFSDIYAESLGFNPREVYLDMLTDLKPKKIRLVAYWSEIEPSPDKFDFKNMDEMIQEAQNRNVEVVLAIGRKLPRWPECHEPDWFKILEPTKQEEATLNMLKAATEHFKKYSAIKAWQVENEPYFVFGIDCPEQSIEMVQKEVQTVKNIDSRPIILTASGEQGDWNYLAKSGADITGITMYRTVYNDHWGYYKYPVGPWFYRIKAGILQKFYGKSVVGVELQAEPWLLSGIFNTDLDTQRSLMNQKIFAQNVAYAEKSGFADHYLWGVEWWYWMAKKQGDFGMWAAAKDLLAR